MTGQGGYWAFGCSLSGALSHEQHLQAIRRIDVRPGDRLIVRTRNSVYTMIADDGGAFMVTGGWFDRKGKTPVKTAIAGCTWGGSMIKVDIVAACGLCLEFGNRVVTSAVQSVTHLKRWVSN